MHKWRARLWLPGRRRCSHAFAQARRSARSDQKQKAALGVHRRNPVVGDTDRRERIWAIARVGGLRRRAAADACFQRRWLQPNGLQLAICSALLLAKPREARGGVRRRCLPSDEREAGRATMPIGGLPAPAAAKLQGFGDVGREDEQVDPVARRAGGDEQVPGEGRADTCLRAGTGIRR
jgi:hypothetical protein